MGFIWGILITILGVVMLIFNRPIYNFTGALDFVEKRFPGNSQAFIKLFAVVLVLGGIIIFSGTSSFITKPLGDWIGQTFRLR